MGFDSWHEFYKSDLQGTFALLPVPALFLAWLIVSRRAREVAKSSARGRALWLWSIFFCVETLLDPVATGPLTRALALPEAVATGVMLLFVLLGDFRVFLLVFLLAPREDRRPALEAAAFTLFVPINAWLGNAALAAMGVDHPQVLWIVYEILFFAMALFLRAVVVPTRTSDPELRVGLRAALAYVALYYALWATSDAIILGADLDAGWLLRALPNQLYYAFWVPFAWWVLAPVGSVRDPDRA